MRVRIPIFAFHRCTRSTGAMSGSCLVVSAQRLFELASWLIDHGYASATVKQLCDELRAEDTASDVRKFVFTFDDGARDNFEVAFPILVELGCTATFFVPAGYIGRASDWRSERSKFEIMSAAQIRRLHESGFEIGSHGWQHTDLTRLPPKELESQLMSSRGALSDITGAEVSTFAYPYGLFDGSVSIFLSNAGYVGACTTSKGSIQDSEHVFALRRIMVTEGTSALRLGYFMSGLLDFEDCYQFGQAACQVKCEGAETSGAIRGLRC